MIRLLILFLLVTATSGCTTVIRRDAPVSPPTQSQVETGLEVVKAAAELIGTPYRFGGATPEGLDCSGLVFFTYRQAGQSVPRTALEQSAAVRAVPLDDLIPGDLIFFRMKSRKVDHVAIFTGQGRFIHAPSTGRVVSYAYVDDPYYRDRISGAGRFR